MIDRSPMINSRLKESALYIIMVGGSLGLLKMHWDPCKPMFHFWPGSFLHVKISDGYREWEKMNSPFALFGNHVHWAPVLSYC